jgi:hypothetical protein
MTIYRPGATSAMQPCLRSNRTTRICNAPTSRSMARVRNTCVCVGSTTGNHRQPDSAPHRQAPAMRRCNPLRRRCRGDAGSSGSSLSPPRQWSADSRSACCAARRTTVNCRVGRSAAGASPTEASRNLIGGTRRYAAAAHPTLCFSPPAFAGMTASLECPRTPRAQRNTARAATRTASPTRPNRTRGAY